MLDLAAFQDCFAAGLRSDAPPAGLGGATAGSDWRERFAVYRNNVVTALADAVIANHPTVERLVGADFMRAAAAAYVRAHPPRRPDLTLAGKGFAAFLRVFGPAQRLPYLPDVAVLDRAWLDALFAEDARALDAAALVGLPPEAIAGLAPGLVAGARIVSSPYPAYSIWLSNREPDGRTSIRLDAGGESALFWRARSSGSGSSVRYRLLSADEAIFARALKAGDSLGDAGVQALVADPGFDIAAAFGGLLAAGALARPHPLDEVAT